MIKEIEKLYKNHVPTSRRKYKESAVMVLLKEINEQWHILFQVRSLNLRTQPGDICLPGGKREKGEPHKETAIRETVEELGIDRDDMTYIGAMDYMNNPYGFRIYPHVAILKENVDLHINEEEVDHVFYVPIEFFLKTEPEGFNIKVGPTDLEGFPFHRIRGGRDYPFRSGPNTKYFYEYKDYTIWGFTADVIKDFIVDLKTLSTSDNFALEKE